MNRQLLPAAMIEDSLERHLGEHSGVSRVLYIACMMTVIGALAALPFAKVAVSVQSRGILRPVVEKQEIRSRVSGTVDRVSLADNDAVEAGDLLVSLYSAIVDERLALTDTLIAEKQRLVGDNRLLLDHVRSALPPGPGSRISALRAPNLGTALYRQHYAQFAAALRDNTAKEQAALSELERVSRLHSRGFATQEALEERASPLREASATTSALIERSRGEWEGELVRHSEELQRLRSEREQLASERELYSIRAPIAGTVELITGVSRGGFVQVGERLAVISPNAPLVAEVVVTPADIGLLAVGTPARLLIDAFNYREWGVVTGAVSEIWSDVTLVDQRPVFKVRCSIARNELRLRNGVTGTLRKGMTLRARFMIAERSLFQLLFDDVDDWLNPVHAAT